MRLIILSVILSLAVIIIANTAAQAKRFHKDGHEIEILWKQKGKKQLRVWGKITGGNNICKQMNYEISFENSETGSYARVSGFVNNYRPTGRNNFKASDEIYNSNYDKSWYVKKYSIDCLN